MKNRLRCIASFAFVLPWITSPWFLTACGSFAAAQEPSIKIPSATSIPKSPLVERLETNGAMTVVVPNPQPEETSIGPVDLDFVEKHPELAWKEPEFEKGAPYFSSKAETLLEKSKGVILRHPVFALEFAFKPMRMIEVETSQGRQLVWYLVYCVRYWGNDLYPNYKDEEIGIAVPETPKRTVSDSVLFIPRFSIYATQSSSSLRETIIPSAKAAILSRERDRIGRPLLDSVEMIRRIPRSTETENREFWGVATWVNVPPAIDFFAVHVEGLTNAYRIKNDASGRILQKKVLQIHFWRPGDSIEPGLDLIRLGVPTFVEQDRIQHVLNQFGLKERLDYTWVYR